MHEFDIIEKYFHRKSDKPDILVGLGDDAAVLAATGRARVICTDTLNEGVHFPKEALPFDIGYKALAVNLSDIAAMGANPQFALMALSLPQVDAQWLDEFAQGFFTLATEFNVELIGGDLTRGPLSINVTVVGEPCNGNYLMRSRAKVGDQIYVTGKLGGAGEALKLIKEAKSLNKELHQRFYRPVPRVAVGIALADIANSAIDISDGLLADLKHILDDSQVGACLNLAAVPHYGDLKTALTAGDDYELCFTAAVDSQESIMQVAKQTGCAITPIGKVMVGKGVIVDEKGNKLDSNELGYRHF